MAMQNFRTLHSPVRLLEKEAVTTVTVSRTLMLFATENHRDHWSNAN